MALVHYGSKDDSKALVRLSVKYEEDRLQPKIFLTVPTHLRHRLEVIEI